MASLALLETGRHADVVRYQRTVGRYLETYDELNTAFKSALRTHNISMLFFLQDTLNFGNYNTVVLTAASRQFISNLSYKDIQTYCFYEWRYVNEATMHFGEVYYDNGDAQRFNVYMSIVSDAMRTYAVCKLVSLQRFDERNAVFREFLRRFPDNDATKQWKFDKSKVGMAQLVSPDVDSFYTMTRGEDYRENQRARIVLARRSHLFGHEC
jgi:hypothetical protein